MIHKNSVNALSQPHTQVNQQQLIVGLTGGIASGKTVVSDWFGTQGIDIVDADVVAHQMVHKDSAILTKIADHFGDWVITKNGSLDRQALRKLVFNDDKALHALENLTHPAIRQRIQMQLLQSRSPYVILSAPLLLEAGKIELANLCQRILVIDVPEHLQLQRGSKRDGQREVDILAIMNKQLSRQQRLSQADDIVINDGSLSDLYEQLLPLHQYYLQIASANAF